MGVSQKTPSNKIVCQTVRTGIASNIDLPNLGTLTAPPAVASLVMDRAHSEQITQTRRVITFLKKRIKILGSCSYVELTSCLCVLCNYYKNSSVGLWRSLTSHLLVWYSKSGTSVAVWHGAGPLITTKSEGGINQSTIIYLILVRLKTQISYNICPHFPR